MLADMKKVRSLLEALEERRAQLSVKPSEAHQSVSDTLEKTAIPLQTPHLDVKICTTRLAPWLLFLGCKGSVISAKTISRTRFAISIRFRVPWYLSGRDKIIAMDFLFSIKSQPWQLLPEASSGIMQLSIVPQSSDIVQACEFGDLATAKRLFATCQASPYDTTSENLTLLYASVEFLSPISQVCNA